MRYEAETESHKISGRGLSDNLCTHRIYIVKGFTKIIRGGVQYSTPRRSLEPIQCDLSPANF